MTGRTAWGVLSTAHINLKVLAGAARSDRVDVVAVGSRDRAKAEAFAASFAQGGVPARAHGSYEALLADPEVDAVYLATPHPQHARWAIAAARAGKHLLCEKPLTLNHAEAMAVAQAAKENGVFLMEAFMYRCHPLTARWEELVGSGAVGKVGLIRATFSFQAHYDPAGRLIDNAQRGGGNLDVG